MTGWSIVGIVVAVVILWQAFAYFSGNPKFWRLVGRNPDLAIKLFSVERDCLVDAAPSNEQRARYVGPFRFLTTDGVAHKVYILEAAISGIQKRLAQVLYAAEGRAPHLGIH